MFEYGNPDAEYEFYLAEKLGMTVEELMTGRKCPLSAYEFMQWQIYYGRVAQRKQLAAEKARGN